MAIKLGILGAARIVPKAILEPASKMQDVVIAGLASSDYERGKQFALEHGISRVYYGYDELLADPEIDAVYIALSNDLHTPWIVAAANAGKHALVEKPLCTSVDDCARIRDAVVRNQTLLHEAIMVRHHPWQQKIKEVIDSKKYGQVRSMRSSFTYTLSENRHNSYRFFPERGGGSFFDNSPYWVQYVQLCLGLNPSAIEARSDFDGPNGIDMDFSASLQYHNDVTVSFFSSYKHPYEANHWIEFEKATLKIRNFFRPNYGRQKLIVNIDGGDLSDRMLFPEANYYENQLVHFLSLIRGEVEAEPMEKILQRIAITHEIYRTAKTWQSMSVPLK